MGIMLGVAALASLGGLEAAPNRQRRGTFSGDIDDPHAPPTPRPDPVPYVHSRPTGPPMNGAREVARRLRQMERAAAKAAAREPVGMCECGYGCPHGAGCRGA
jgi:hypothetical protein